MVNNLGSGDRKESLQSILQFTTMINEYIVGLEMVQVDSEVICRVSGNHLQGIALSFSQQHLVYYVMTPQETHSLIKFNSSQNKNEGKA